MVIAEVRMYDALKPALGEDDARAFIGAMVESVNTKMQIMKDDLATKKDLQEVRNELHSVRNELKLDIANLRTELKGDMGLLRGDMLRAIYITSLSQLIIIIGAVLAIIKSNQ